MEYFEINKICKFWKSIFKYFDVEINWISYNKYYIIKIKKILFSEFLYSINFEF